MNPKQLKSVFTWETRRVVIQDRVWHFPDYYDDPDFVFPGWGAPELFGNSNPVNIEYCSGHGHWIAERAKANPDQNWVAVEKQFVRVKRIWSKLKNDGLDNLIVVCGEGGSWTRKYVPDATVQQVFVNFPDPWPKARHAKNRIIQRPFAEEMRRILTPSGTVTLVTDDGNYSRQMHEVFSTRGDFESSYVYPHYLSDLSDYGNSYFGSLWRSKGKMIHYLKFEAA